MLTANEKEFITRLKKRQALLSSEDAYVLFLQRFNYVHSAAKHSSFYKEWRL